MSKEIKPRTFELIARYIGERMIGSAIVNLLKRCGVPDDMIHYPDSKWRMVLNAFSLLQDARKQDKILKIVEEFCHPLNFAGSNRKADQALKVFNDWLKYDGLKIFLSSNGATIVDLDANQNDNGEFRKYINDKHKKAIGLLQSKYLEDIILMKKAYQLLMNVVDSYLENPGAPNENLNKYYVKMSQLLNKTAEKVYFGLRENKLENVVGDSIKAIPNYPYGDGIYKPFRNLYSASGEMNGMTTENIGEIRSQMNTYLGDIIELCYECEAGDVIQTTSTQELFNEISLYLTNQRAKKEQKQNIKAVDLGSVENTILETHTKPFYDPIKREINFHGKITPIPRDTDQHDVCKIVLKDGKAIKVEWSWDRIFKPSSDHDEDKKLARKVYNAGREINDKVAKETTIKDLLIVTTNTIQVNPKYVG